MPYSSIKSVPFLLMVYRSPTITSKPLRNKRTVVSINRPSSILKSSMSINFRNCLKRLISKPHEQCSASPLKGEQSALSYQECHSTLNQASRNEPNIAKDIVEQGTFTHIEALNQCCYFPCARLGTPVNICLRNSQYRITIFSKQ